MRILSYLTGQYQKYGAKSLGIVFALTATAFLFLVGILPAIEQSNRDVRSAVFSRDASGQYAVVEMDARSLKALGNWPWSREIHAQLVDKLSAGGADQIAFDIDFSARSTPAADSALASAIDRSDAQVIMATFRQRASDASGSFSENIPLPALARNSLLASVNVHPDKMGYVSEYSYGIRTDGAVRPALAAMLTGSNGDIGQSFLIDQSLNLASIPRFSAVDILNDKVSTADIQDRSFIIGATAIELGDRYATPHLGIIPGVFIHALATETLDGGRNMPIVSTGIMLGIALLLALLSKSLTTRSISRYRHFILPLSTLLLIGSNWWFFAESIAELQLSAAFTFILCLYLADLVIDMFRAMQRERYSDIATGLPNAEAMMKAASKLAFSRIAVAEIANFNEIATILTSEQQAENIKSLAKRLSLLADEGRIYRTGKDQLAWNIAASYHDRLDDHFKTAAAFALAPTAQDGHDAQLKIHMGYHEGENYNWHQLLSDASAAARKAAVSHYRWVRFSKDINEGISEKLNILNEIDRAMSQGDIWVAYQPKLDMKTGAINAAEALVRWDHPQRGRIAPDRFIPILEAEGTISDLTLYVLKKTLQDVSRWAENGLFMNCSVNVSAALLDDAEFIGEAITLVETGGIDSSQITFELTETAALGDLEKAKSVLNGIREIGVRLSIDDYGTGQSNLSYMQGFPADEIKIDQRFVKSMVQRDVDRVMVSSTIDMAHKMNFKVVAEGVEDEDCLALLSKFGCDVAQGWHIGKPLDAESFAQRWRTGAIAKSA